MSNTASAGFCSLQGILMKVEWHYRCVHCLRKVAYAKGVAVLPRGQRMKHARASVQLERRFHSWGMHFICEAAWTGYLGPRVHSERLHHTLCVCYVPSSTAAERRCAARACPLSTLCSAAFAPPLQLFCSHPAMCFCPSFTTVLQPPRDQQGALRQGAHRPADIHGPGECCRSSCSGHACRSCCHACCCCCHAAAMHAAVAAMQRPCMLLLLLPAPPALLPPSSQASGRGLSSSPTVADCLLPSAAFTHPCSCSRSWGCDSTGT